MDGANTLKSTQFAPLELAQVGSESALRGLFDTLFEDSEAGLAILGLDHDGAGLKVLDGNTRLLSWLGRTRESLLGADFLNLLTPDSRTEHRPALQRAAIGWRSGSFRLTLAGAEASLPCALTLRPVRENGLRCRLLAILHADSDDPHRQLSLAERERDAARQTRNCLMAHLSHDLRTPLNGILGFAELLQQQTDADPDTPRDYASHIALAGRDLLRRIEDLLTTADMMPPHAPETGGEVDPGRLVEELRPTAMEEAARLGLDLDIHMATKPPMLRARSGDLKRLLEATLDCSLRGTPRGGRIRFSLRRTSDHSLLLSFEDSGPAITEDALSALYDSAFSGEDIYTCRGERSAAGLVTARFLAESNGGSLYLAGNTSTAGHACHIRFPPDRLAVW